jgi:hypothetical protein
VIDAEEREAMRATVRGAIEDALASEGERADVDAVLARLGWRELLREEPDDAIAIVFGALGATNAAATALDDVLAGALGREPHASLAVLLPPFATWDPAGRIGAGELRAEGLATARADGAEEILVAGGAESKPWLASVVLEAAAARPVGGIDPAAALRVLSLRSSAARAAELDPAAWPRAVALGRRALAHQIAGACRAMLELARGHAQQRVQFGRPIARFQAVRHRLADALVALEALEATLHAARDAPGPDTAALAKAAAGRSAQSVARHCQQVLAGIGFTTEHSFHRFLKRSLALEGLLGSADAIVLDVGRRLLAERRAPALIQL